MDSKELRWFKERRGLITASELPSVCSLSGKITDDNISYIRRKRFERNHGFMYSISGRALDIGKEQEAYAVKWWRRNKREYPIQYAQECSEIPFWRASWAKFGASPDAFAFDRSYVLEIKTVVGNTAAEFFADPYTSYGEKKQVVMKEHGAQIAGQFLSEPRVERIFLLKYIYQRDEEGMDLDSPTSPWRGVVFEFERKDFDLEDIKNRIILFDLFIDSEYDARSLKSQGYALGAVRTEQGDFERYSLIPPGE